MQQSWVWLFWLPYQTGQPYTRHSQPNESELTKITGRKDAQRVVQREKSSFSLPSLPPAPWSGYNLRHLKVEGVLKPVLPLEFALWVVRISFWGDEQLQDVKSEWGGGRKRKQVEERGRKSKDLGTGKDLPIPPSQKNGWVLVRLLKIPFSLLLSLLFYWCKWTAGAILNGSDFSPFSTIFPSFFSSKIWL